MELRRLSLWMAFLAVAFIMQCSEAHTTHKRGVEEVDYSDPAVQNDEGSDDEAQNDAEGGDDEAEVLVNIVTIPSYYNVTVGKTIRLECKTVSVDGQQSTENVVVQWTKNGTKYFIGTQKPRAQDLSLYIRDPRFIIAENSTDLLIRDVKPQDSGLYKCEVLQYEDSNKQIVREINHTVVVLESPRIIKLSATNNGRVREGQELRLTCEVAGTPPPQILWSRVDENQGNHRLNETDGVFTANSVTIHKVEKQHQGSYFCYALNSAGHKEEEITVTVVGKPHVHVPRTAINSDIGVTAVLECSTKDDAPPHIRWYKDGRLLEDAQSHYSVSTDGHHSNLTLTPSSDEDFGTFTCEAENSLGSHNRSIELVQRPIVASIAGVGDKVLWTVHSHQAVEEIDLKARRIDEQSDWFRQEVEPPQQREHLYEMSQQLSAEPGSYEVILRVRNSKAWSDYSPRVTVDVGNELEGPETIQHASVFRGSSPAILPTETLLAAALMYLLVRMF